jgi:acyl-CoA synthetase (AMP-forming)/AMP-acid ligase II
MIDGIDFESDATALFQEGRDRSVSYRELSRRVDAMRALLRDLPRPAFVLQFAASGPPAIASYLACLAEGMPLGLGEPASTVRNRVVAAYLPTALLLSAEESSPPEDYELAAAAPVGGLALWRRTDRSPYPFTPHPDLALLLATSGSTGDAKFVRLSRANLLANARSIARFLAIADDDSAIQSLPIHYSYGLSVVNSHLVSGASIAFTAHSFIRPEFWRVVDECSCTSFAGVPYMYETLNRLKMAPTDRRSIRTMTQAGGHLRTELALQFHAAATKAGARFYVMYGQTEATARMAYVPPESLAEKAGTIGIAIPGGELWLEPLEDDSKMQQLFFRGPNVMLGYASCPADLSRGDDQRGVLATGDLGERDDDGFFRITGRLARFAKLFGKRVNLATIESDVENLVERRAAALDGGDRIRVFVEGGGDEASHVVRAYLSAMLGVPPVAIETASLPHLPMTSSGKKDYRALA